MKIEINFPNAVTSRQHLFCRSAEIDQIEAVFIDEKRVPVIILGERCVGKTSLQNVIIRRLAAIEQPHFVPVSIEPRGIATFADFSRAVLHLLADHIHPEEQTMALMNSTAAIETIEQFEVVFGRVLKNRPERLVICIDELDEIFRKTSRAEFDKLSGLIFSTTEKSTIPLHFLFTMTSIPEALQNEFPSMVVSISQVQELYPFTFDEMAEMVTGITTGQISWTPEALDALFLMSGGHPYFTKLLLEHVVAARRKSPTPDAVECVEVQNAFEKALADARTNHVMLNLYRVHFNDSEKQLVLLLANRQCPLLIEELRSAGASWVKTARKLQKRCYLIENDGRYSFRISLLGEWLRRWIEFEEEYEKFPLLKQLSTPVDITINEAAGQVHVSGQLIKLSSQEFAILCHLGKKAEQCVTREELVDTVWGSSFGVTDQTIDTALYRLRKKMNDQGQYIETLPGRGFVLHKAVFIPNTTGEKGAVSKGGSS